MYCKFIVVSWLTSMLSEATADEEIGHISSSSWSCLCMDAEHVCKTERSASLIYKN